jgi:hypothetical protein
MAPCLSVYTKDELGRYLEHTRNKCRSVIGTLTEEEGARTFQTRWLELSFTERLLYPLPLILRQDTGAAPRWVKPVRE